MTDGENQDIVMYIFVNNDLGMTKGKTCSQVGHIVQLICEEIIRSGYEKYPPPEAYIRYMKWKQNCVKIVLKATMEQLNELKKLDEARYIIDSGKTQIAPNSLTVVGFFPSSKMKDIAKNYKLL